MDSTFSKYSSLHASSGKLFPHASSASVLLAGSKLAYKMKYVKNRYIMIKQ